MPATGTLERRAGHSSSAQRSNELIGRAAKHAGWACAALESAARDLDGTWGADGNQLSGLVEVVQDEAARVCSLAEEIESRSTSPRVGETGRSVVSRNGPSSRSGRIVGAVAQVLSAHDEALQAREVHVRVEALLEEPVRWASVKASLAGNVGGPAPRFQRVARGRYTTSPGLPVSSCSAS
jgi:hypothetical protein